MHFFFALALIAILTQPVIAAGDQYQNLSPVDFYDGRVEHYQKYGVNCVWPVRGGK